MGEVGPVEGDTNSVGVWVSGDTVVEGPEVLSNKLDVDGDSVPVGPLMGLTEGSVVV